MSRKKQVTCLLLVMILLMTGIISGCGNKSSDDTADSGDGKTLTLMCVGTSADPYLEDYKNVVKSFNETNQLGVTVNIEFYENEQYKTKLTTLMASNSVPDMFFTWELSYLKPFVEGGKVADLTSYLDADEEWKNSFADGTLEQLTFDDKVYAIPTQKSLCVMFYNKKIFEENNVKVPETWDEFLSVCETLKTNGVTPMAMCGSDAWIPAQFVQQISNGIAGLDLYTGICGGSRQWNDAAHIEAADELQKMVDAGYFQNGFIGMGPEESTALFKEGKAAMYFQGAWDCNTVYSGSIGEDAGVFALPAKNPEYNNISVGSVDTSFAIAETCKNKEAAVEFLKYWSSAEVEKNLLYSQGRMPAAVFEIDESKLNPLFAETLKVSNEQVGLTPWWDRAFGAGEGTEFNNTCVSVCGGEDVQECFDALQQFAEDNADR